MNIDRAPWAAAALTAAACATAPAPKPDPFAEDKPMREIKVCETAIDRTVCGGWSWDGPNGRYLARYDNGDMGALALVAWDGKNIVLARTDDGGPRPGLTGRYAGQRTGEGMDGTATWSWNGKSWGGSWKAALGAPAPNAP